MAKFLAISPRIVTFLLHLSMMLCYSIIMREKEVANVVANTTVAEQTKFQRFFASICSTWIEERNRAKCNKAKDLVTLVGSLAVSILGLLGALQIHWLLIIAIVVAACTITIFLGLQYVANLIDKEEVNEINALKSQILELSNSNRANETLYQEEKEYNKYLACLWTETSLLAKAIRKTNASKTTKGLYTKITSSIIEMITTYLGIRKDNFAVHVYAYDGSARVVRRVDVESFVKTKQAADENLPQSIDDPEISKRFYAKSILSNKKIITLPTPYAIRENLFFPVDDDVIIDQHTQYAAMIYDVGSRVKLYIEVISYNGLYLGKDKESLELFVKKVIAPFSSLLTLVDWNTIRSDCDAN